MGTSNFHYKDKLFMVEIDNEYETEDGEIVFDEWAFDNYREWMVEELAEISKTLKSKNKKIELNLYPESKPQYCHNSPYSFPACSYAELQVESEFMGVSLELTLKVLLRSGYYEHANIDYEWSLNVEGIEFDVEGTDAFDVFEWIDFRYTGINNGLIAINKKHLDVRLITMANMANMATEVFEFIAKRLSTSEYTCAVQFSNGETLFSKVESEEEGPTLFVC